MAGLDNLFLSLGSVFIDDVILPDGRSKMGMLGGGATYAVMGMRVWSERVAFVGGVGCDFPSNMHADLAKFFNLKGLVQRELPTPRAWQLFEKDGTRNEIFRTNINEVVEIFPKPSEFPKEYDRISGAHLTCNLEEIPVWVDLLRKRGNPLIIWEPWDRQCIPENRAMFREFGSMVDVISPNLLESQTLTGIDSPHEIIQALLQFNAPVIALRMGEKGSLVARKGEEPIHFPAVPVEPLVDLTGAGNAYCGGFIVGLAQTHDLVKAGNFAAVSSSFILEQFGALFSMDEIRKRAAKRVKKYLVPKINSEKQVFENLAENWDAIPAPVNLQENLNQVAKWVLPNTGGTVIDVGSGTGILLPYLLERKPDHIICIDLSRNMLTKASKKVGSNPSISSTNADALYIPYISAFASAITCCNTFAHFPDFYSALFEFQRVLLPGGRLAICHTNGKEQVNKIHSESPASPFQHDLLPDAETVSQMLHETGWTVLETLDNPDFYLVVAENWSLNKH